MRSLSLSLPAAARDAVPRSLSLPALVLAGMVIGTLDLAACSAFWILRGVPPVRIAESLAVLLVGTDAHAMGAGGVLLGLMVEWAIGIAMVGGYVLAAGLHRQLLLQPRRYGLLYGAAAYAVFEWVVLPLSAAPAHASSPEWQFTLLLIFMVVMGIPSGLLARRLLQR